jgi:hypothetical protein
MGAIWLKNANFSPIFFVENISKIITYVGLLGQRAEFCAPFCVRCLGKWTIFSPLVNYQILVNSSQSKKDFLQTWLIHKFIFLSCVKVQTVLFGI